MMKTTRRTQLTNLLALFFAFFVVNGCEDISPWNLNFNDAQPTTLKIAALAGTLVKDHTNDGLEHDLLERFAQDNSLSIQWTTYPNEIEMAEAVSSGQAHIAAGRLPAEGALAYQLIDGPTYEETELSLACNSGFNYKRSPWLTRKEGRQLWLAEGRSYAHNLETKLQEVPQQSIYFVKGSTYENLKKLNSKKTPVCLLIERTELNYYLRFFPKLFRNDQIAIKTSVAFWINPKEQDLRSKFATWFRTVRRTGYVSEVRHQYTDHFSALNVSDLKKVFDVSRIKSRALAPLFRKAGIEFDLPWQLIAAVAFQESHWNNHAVSFTGVKGIMMLTKATAEFLGVEQRQDLKQSIIGGAQYLSILLKQQPSHLPHRSRLALALASYNVGPGHLQDAVFLTRNMGMDPTKWTDLKQVLPKLSDPQIAKQLKFGLARGAEPVKFVDRVFAYYDLLSATL